MQRSPTTLIGMHKIRPFQNYPWTISLKQTLNIAKYQSGPVRKTAENIIIV